MSEDSSAAAAAATKRPREDSPEDSRPPAGREENNGAIEDDDDDDDVGPMPMSDVGMGAAPKKKRKVLPHEQLFLDHLPSADRYSKSFMHRDVLNFVEVAKTDFIITTSVDGHLKIWKKQEIGIEFVKHYRAHSVPISAIAVSADGQLCASMAEDGSVKVFDVVNFDMINMMKLDFVPLTCCWVHKRGQAQSLLAISDSASGAIHIYDGRGNGTALEKVSIHQAPVHLMKYTDRYDTVVSADQSGFLEYWQPREPFEPPKVRGMWELKSSTDLYEFKKTKSTPTSLTFSPSSSHFATISFPSQQIRIFNFLTGKLYRAYDESMSAVQAMQQAGTAVYKLDDMEFGRRLAVERELEKDPKAGATMNAIWDESGNFLLYPTMLGIKVVNILNNRVVRLLGKDETGRWLNLSLYQGAPAKKGMSSLAAAASANPILQSREVRDPTLFCTAFKRPRFYMFTRAEPEDTKGQADRDVLNEKPSREEQTLAVHEGTQSGKASKDSPFAHSAVIHTTLGDMHCKLFPQHAPKAVENFVGHARSGYFEGVIFHRVIKKFMIQTGDPLGDGTGGTSIWDREFEDEFTDQLRHNQPYTLSMANAGPNTNGSQFFITTTVTPWLDNKHTIFGRVISGLEVVHNIENVRTNKVDKPFEDIKIISVDVE
ncbi:hypothetical protein DL93DRAFT_2053995 [Clavulina sp. PMI_390]|nr:hypothetical protein DL93DRAFT_2053995 [Clavulina sp. PMI_390]